MKHIRYIKTLTIILLVLSTTLLGACGSSSGGDGGSEDSDIIFLDSTTEGGVTDSFLAKILVNTPSASDTGIVLIHGRGGHPDKAVVRQLRHDLFDRGFTTIGIQAPVPAGYVEGGEIPDFSEYTSDINGANYVFPETYARVRTAISHLESLDINKIIIIGFSMGSRMGAAYIARGQPVVKFSNVIGFIGIGMRSVGIDPLNPDSTLDELMSPVLDLYGDGDTTAVNTAAGRAAVYTVLSYTQIELDCAAGLSVQECHKLDGLKGTSTSPLESTVSSWITILLLAIA